MLAPSHGLIKPRSLASTIDHGVVAAQAIIAGGGAWLLMSSTQNMIVSAPLFALASGAGMYRAWRSGKWLSLLPTSRIRSAAQGKVEICGKAVADPSSDSDWLDRDGNRLVWAEVVVSRRVGRGRGSRREIVERASWMRPITIDDGTGQISVIVPAEVERMPTFKWFSLNSRLSQPAWRQFPLTRFLGMWFGYLHKIAYISEGDDLTVVGDFHTDNSSQAHTIGGSDFRMMWGTEARVRLASNRATRLYAGAAALFAIAGVVVLTLGGQIGGPSPQVIHGCYALGAPALVMVALAEWFSRNHAVRSPKSATA